jgi:hypothetical protein
MFRVDFPLDLRALQWYENHRTCGSTIEVYSTCLGPEQSPGMLDLGASYNCLRCHAGEHLREEIPITTVLAVLEKVLRQTAHCVIYDPMIKVCMQPDAWIAARQREDREEA